MTQAQFKCAHHVDINRAFGRNLPTMLKMNGLYFPYAIDHDFAVRMPMDYKSGTKITPQVLWAPVDFDGSVTWRLQYGIEKEGQGDGRTFNKKGAEYTALPPVCQGSTEKKIAAAVFEGFVPPHRDFLMIGFILSRLLGDKSQLGNDALALTVCLQFEVQYG